MTDQEDQFVFVVNEAKPFSRPSISTINSHVAKYAHSRRRQQGGARNRIRRCQPYFTVSVEDKADESQSWFEKSPDSEPRSWRTPPSCHDMKTKHMPCCRRVELNMVMDHKNLLKYRSNTGNSSKWDGNYGDTASDALLDLRVLKELPPLCTYPADLNSEEQFLMHHWFTRVFPEDFSTTLRFDGFMGPLSRYPTTFSVPLRWAIAKAAERLLGDKAADAARLVCQSRTKAIEEWRVVMSDPYISTDEVLASAVYTIVKNDGNEKMHLKGLDTIIAARGGLDTVLRETKVVQPEHIVHMYTFAPFTIDTYNVLVSLKRAFFTAFSYIQSGMRSSFSSAVCDTGIAENHLPNHYDILSEASVVGRHIRLEFDTSNNYSLKARHFCAMLMLNLSLLSLDSTADRSEFLRQLEKAANAAAFPDPVTGQLRIRAGAFVFMIGHVYGVSLKKTNNINVLSAAIGVATAAIASMKIFGLLSDAMQLQFFSCLQHALIQLNSNAESFAHAQSFMSNGLEDFSIVASSREIDKLWLKLKISPTINLICRG